MADRLHIAPRDGLGIATVMARKGVSPTTLAARLGCEPSDGPRAVFNGRRTVVGSGPGGWLVIEEKAAPDFAERLAESLAGLASVSDQSSGYVVQQLSGVDARRLLQRGLAIDLHPAHFTRGSAATSVIAHIGVIIWQTDDQPSYSVATFRSLAASFRHWLDETAAAL